MNGHPSLNTALLGEIKQLYVCMNSKTDIHSYSVFGSNPLLQFLHFLGEQPMDKHPFDMLLYIPFLSAAPH